MQRAFGLAGILLTLILAVFLGFSLYAHFLVDYSLDSLELALSETEKRREHTASYSGLIYRNLVKDLAVEEAVRTDGNLKDLSLLELAARSLGEAENRAGQERAKLYLLETVKSKIPDRHKWLVFTDAVYRTLRELYFRVLHFTQYLQRLFFKPEEKVLDVSSYLLLNQAEEHEKKWQMDEAAELYRRFLKLYPDHPDRSFVMISLSNVLIKQKRYHEAERILRGIAVWNAGMEEFRIASALLKKITDFKKRDREIQELEQVIARTDPSMSSDALKLKLALLYLFSYSLDRSQELLLEIEDAPDRTVRQKAKFYLGWIYKQQSQLDQGADALLKLASEESLLQDLGPALHAQLADIYYQKDDWETSLDYFKRITAESGRQGDKIGQDIWPVVAGSESAAIYYFHLGDKQKAGEHLNLLAERFPHYGSSIDLRAAFEEASSIDLKALAFDQLRQGNVYGAYRIFKKKVMQTPRDAWARAGLATATVLLTDLYDAYEEARLAYSLQPDLYTASVLAYVMAYQGRYQDSVWLYKEALSYDENAIPVLYNLAGVYLAKRSHDPAFELLSVLETKFRGSESLFYSRILNNLGYAMWWLGDTEKARNRFEQALKIYPGFPDAQSNLSRILSEKPSEWKRDLSD